MATIINMKHATCKHFIWHADVYANVRCSFAFPVPPFVWRRPLPAPSSPFDRRMRGDRAPGTQPYKRPGGWVKKKRKRKNKTESEWK